MRLMTGGNRGKRSKSMLFFFTKWEKEQEQLNNMLSVLRKKGAMTLGENGVLGRTFLCKRQESFYLHRFKQKINVRLQFIMRQKLLIDMASGAAESRCAKVLIKTKTCSLHFGYAVLCAGFVFRLHTSSCQQNRWQELLPCITISQHLHEKEYLLSVLFTKSLQCIRSSKI